MRAPLNRLRAAASEPEKLLISMSISLDLAAVSPKARSLTYNEPHFAELRLLWKMRMALLSPEVCGRSPEDLWEQVAASLPSTPKHGRVNLEMH